jgi:DNA-binding MarR family transcriptional regulator
MNAHAAGEASHAATAELLLITAHRLAIEMTHELGFEHVSVMGLITLQMLARQPRRLRSLAAALGCSRAAAGQTVGRLVRDGFVEQTRNANDDQRAKLIHVTESGRAHGELAADALERCMASITEELTADDRSTLATLLSRVERGAEWHRVQRLWGIWGTAVRWRRPPAIHVR